MKGHIRERSPGHWAIVIDVRDPQTGKRKRRWHSFKGTKRQAQIRMRAAGLRTAARWCDRAEQDHGRAIPRSVRARLACHARHHAQC